MCANSSPFFRDGKEDRQRLLLGTTYALTSELSFGKSLGGTLNRKGVMAVLAKSLSSADLVKAEGNMHLGIRTRLLTWLAEADPLALRTDLNRGCVLAKQYNIASNFKFTKLPRRVDKKGFQLRIPRGWKT